MFRSSPSEEFSENVLCKHEANPLENNNAELRIQQICSVTLLISYLRMEMLPKICSRSAEHLPPGQHLWGAASACQKNFKRLKLLKVFIYSCRKKSFNAKNE